MTRLSNGTPLDGPTHRIASASVFERGARVIGVGALLLALLIALVRIWNPSMERSANSALRVRVISTTDAEADRVAARLAHGIVSHVVTGDHRAWPAVQASALVVPSARTRDVFSTVIRAGVPFHWQDSTHVTAFALSVGAVPSPVAATLVQARAVTASAVKSAALTTALTVRDGGGLLDSIAGDTATIRLRVAQSTGAMSSQLWRSGMVMAAAQVPAPESVTVRAVLVVGAIGWETKFVAAALEESGWQVDASIVVAPRANIRVGTPGSLDTSRYSAVVVLDSGIVAVPTLQRFVSQGGGVVVAGNALRDSRLAAFASTTVSIVRPPIAGALLTDAPRRGLPAFVLTARPGVTVLDREDARPTVVVARNDVGRVVASGYLSTWRWRMEGRDDGSDAHRQWWHSVVSTVAFVPWSSTAGAETGTRLHWPGDAAPKADMIARFGRPVDRFTEFANAPRRVIPPLWLLVVIAMGALVAEWATRRLRGAR